MNSYDKSILKEVIKNHPYNMAHILNNLFDIEWDIKKEIKDVYLELGISCDITDGIITIG